MGSVSFFFESERGLFPNTEYLFDLELPATFEPRCIDGEVQAFELIPIDKCIERMCLSSFKTTSAPVVLDFLIRHGYVTPENGEISIVLIISFTKKNVPITSFLFSEPHFTEIVELIHIPLQSLYKLSLVTSNGNAKNGYSSQENSAK